MVEDLAGPGAELCAAAAAVARSTQAGGDAPAARRESADLVRARDVRGRALPGALGRRVEGDREHRRARERFAMCVERLPTHAGFGLQAHRARVDGIATGGVEGAELARRVAFGANHERGALGVERRVLEAAVVGLDRLAAELERAQRLAGPTIDDAARHHAAARQRDLEPGGARAHARQPSPLMAWRLGGQGVVAGRESAQSEAAFRVGLHAGRRHGGAPGGDRGPAHRAAVAASDASLDAALRVEIAKLDHDVRSFLSGVESEWLERHGHAALERHGFEIGIAGG